MFELLLNATQDRDGRRGTSSGYTFTFDGDLNQMSEQREFLQRQGFEVGMTNVYPAVKTQAEYDKAITAIYKNRCAGYWHYREKLIKLGVCTEAEFTAALDVTCALEQARYEAERGRSRY